MSQNTQQQQQQNQQRRKPRQNARSTQFAQNRARLNRLSLGDEVPPPTNRRVRVDWERRGPGDMDVLQFAHSWVCRSEASIKATSDDTYFSVDLTEYVKDMRELPTRIRGFVLLFEANIAGSFCLVQKKDTGGSFKDGFSSLNAFKFEKGVKTGVQLLAPDSCTFASLKAGEVGFVMKFNSTMTKGAEFLTRKVWGQSDRLPEIAIPANLLRPE